MEMARLLGVDHVIAYVTNEFSSEGAIVLQHYVDTGYVTALPWILPPQPSHYYSQETANNDSMMRMRHIAR